MKWLVGALVATALAVTGLTLLGAHWWVAELFTHFRIQYLLLGGLALALSLVARRPVAASVLTVCLVAQAVPVIGYLRQPVERTGTAGLRIVSTNVHAANQDPTALLELVAAVEPDVVLILEHTERFARALESLRDRYPHQLSAPADDAFGIGLYSRVPPDDARTVALGMTDAVRASVPLDGRPLHFVGTHLVPPTSESRAAGREAQLASLASLTRGAEGPMLVCGDFNLTPFSPSFAAFVDASGLRPLRPPGLWARTWPVGIGGLGIPIDHCFASPGVAIVSVEILGDVGSDHYPLLVEITHGEAR